MLGQKQTKEPQSVCDVLKNIGQLRGKVITVRGIYHADYHGSVLEQKDCGEQIQLDGAAWPVAIHLQSAGYYADEEEAQVKVPFSPDLRTIARIEGAINRALRENPDARIRLSVTGFLIAPEKYTSVSEQDRTVKIGFGHGNRLPAEIIVKRYAALVIDKDPRAAPPTGP
jgi:hypothetical protein